MLNFEFREFLQEVARTLPLDSSIPAVDAEKKAANLLIAMAKIADARHIISEDKIKALSTQSATFSAIMSIQTGKTMTENKTSTEADPVYIKVREDLERIDNDLAYLRAYYDIFLNSHLFYRQMARGDSF